MNAEKIRILVELDVPAFDRLMLEKFGEQPNCREVSLAAMHKARFYLVAKGAMPRRYFWASRQWLFHNGYKLPTVIRSCHG